MSRARAAVVAAALVVVASGFTGCGGSSTGPAIARATGSVSFQNQPVAGASVVFYPAGGSEAALTSQAATDDQGQFQLTTHVGGGKFAPGVAPGRYEVAITKLDVGPATSTLSPPKNLLPRKYADPKTSKLTAEVTVDRENKFNFALMPE